SWISQDSTNAIAARAADGSVGLAYTRDPGSLKLDLSKFGSGAVVERVDPTNAAVTSIAGSAVTLDQKNATGTDDWVLRVTVP
ncbi:MAG: hypothetical protein KC776_09740, partial [Myxococcales bacterium]|nr:hypothetical protein [Myxococcales bacterium]